jgi:transposase-like protein
MIKKQRRKFTNEFKFKVVLIAISDKYSIKEIAEMFDLDIKQITNWKEIFS